MTLSILNYKRYLLLCGGLLSFTANVNAAGIEKDCSNHQAHTGSARVNCNDDEYWDILLLKRSRHSDKASFFAEVKKQFPNNKEILDLANTVFDIIPGEQIAPPPVAYAGPGSQKNECGNVSKKNSLTYEERLALWL